MVFSAHGVSPEVHQQAEDRSLKTIDATCPLVTKVHHEARRFAADDYDILLIGHAGHEEVEGTAGEAPEHIQLVQTPEDVATVVVRDPAKVAWLSQTTLSVDETMTIVDAIRARFPLLLDPPSDDICYATQNRQMAIKEISVDARPGDRRRVRATPRTPCAWSRSRSRPAPRRRYRVDDASEIEESWLEGVETVSVTSGASVPEDLVDGVLSFLAERGYPDAPGGAHRRGVADLRAAAGAATATSGPRPSRRRTSARPADGARVAQRHLAQPEDRQRQRVGDDQRDPAWWASPDTTACRKPSPAGGDGAAGRPARAAATVPAIASGGKTPMTKKSWGRTASAAPTQAATRARSKKQGRSLHHGELQEDRDPEGHGHTGRRQGRRGGDLLPRGSGGERTGVKVRKTHAGLRARHAERERPGGVSPGLLGLLVHGLQQLRGGGGRAGDAGPGVGTGTTPRSAKRREETRTRLSSEPIVAL